MTENSREMPKYKCKKVVWALKIKELNPYSACKNCESDGSYVIVPEEEGFGPFRVDVHYMNKHTPEVGGYYVVYKGGYKSYSPADAFENGYDEIKNNKYFVNYGDAIKALKQGNRITRRGWNASGMFVFKQIPAEIGLDVIPKMQSVPQSIKDEMLKSGITLKYTNQMAIVHPDGRVDSWVASSSDTFAEDWVILD